MRLAPPLRTTARNPVIDAALAQRRATDEACLQLAVDAMHDGDDLDDDNGRPMPCADCGADAEEFCDPGCPGTPRVPFTEAQ